MSFYNSILKKLNINPENNIGGNKISLFDGKGALIEGHNGIFSYAPTEIIIKLKKQNLTLNGNNLKVAEINKDELYITGQILKVDFE